MAVILVGLVIVLFTTLSLLPENINFSNAIKIASVNSKMEVLNFSFDLEIDIPFGVEFWRYIFDDVIFWY